MVKLMIELRGIEVYWDNGDKVIEVVVRTQYPDIFEKKELYRNKSVNRGRINTSLGNIYGVPPGQIVWPAHIEL